MKKWSVENFYIFLRWTFLPSTVFSYLTWFGRKMEFFNFKKPFSIDKTITVVQKWLVNELSLQFLIIRKCTKFQSNRLILSKVIEYTYRQTGTISKTIFSNSGGLKTWRFDKKRGIKFCINLIHSLMRM